MKRTWISFFVQFNRTAQAQNSQINSDTEMTHRYRALAARIVLIVVLSFITYESHSAELAPGEVECGQIVVQLDFMARYQFVQNNGCCDGSYCIGISDLQNPKAREKILTNIRDCGEMAKATIVNCGAADRYLGSLKVENGYKYKKAEVPAINEAAAACKPAADACVKSCRQVIKEMAPAQTNADVCGKDVSKVAALGELSTQLEKIDDSTTGGTKDDGDGDGTKWGEVGKQMLVGAAPGIAGSLIPGALSLLGQRKPDKMPTQEYEFGECEKNPNSPECYCRQHGYAPPECKPYAGSESSRRSSLQTDGTDVDQAVKDALEAARLAAELEKNKAAPKKDETPGIPGGGGGDSLGSSRVGSGAPLDDGKKKNAPALAAEVPVGSSSVRGYSYGGGTNSPFIADRSNLYGKLAKPGNNFGDLKEFLPKGMANDRSRMPAGMVVEVTGANGLSNFEKIRRRYKDRCPLMKKEFCI